MRFNKQFIIYQINSRLEIFDDVEINNTCLNEIRNIINEYLNQYLKEHEVYSTDFPIYINNNLGNWEIHHTGTVLFQPKVKIKKLVIHISKNK